MALYIVLRGTKRVEGNLQRLARGTWPAVRESLELEAALVMERSDELVPELDSDLRNSGYTRDVTLPRSGESHVRFGYSAPHAVATHENPRAGRTGGMSPSGHTYSRWATKGEWKYLQRAIQERENGMSSRLGSRIQAAWQANIVL
jgi:hypothetical protein